MKSPFPYHFCAALGCREMIPPGDLYCADHFAEREMEQARDAFFPDLDDDFADPCQEGNQP